jgi:hypothetical protein
MSKLTDKDRVEKLENQIKLLRKEKLFLQKKLSDTQKSRDKWKGRFKELDASTLSTVGLGGVGIFEGDCAKGYQYCLPLILLCIRLQSFGTTSLRGVVHILLCIQLSIGKKGSTGIPCASTIRMWVCKVGKWQIGRTSGSGGKRWVYWVDESIHIGGEKVLLVLGKCVSGLKYQEALCLKDMTVLYMDVSSQWTGEQISKVLQQLQANYPLAYIVSDMGSNLQRAYALENIMHIPDCTHTFSKILAHIYEENDTFKAFTVWTSTLRKKWILCKDKKTYIPPAQRTKARFANLFPLIEWAYKQLTNWQTLPVELREAFDFLQQHQDWISHFFAIQQRVKSISKLLKNRGYNTRNHHIAERLIKNIDTKDTNTDLFVTQVKTYLQTLKQLSEQKLETTICCCSDIIESAFGKMKQKLASSSTPHLTEFIFTLANATGDISMNELRQALENTRDKDIKGIKNTSEKPPKTTKNSTEKKSRF